MGYYLGYFIGAVLLIWLLSGIFTFIQKLITKRVTHNIVIITTIIAGSFCLIAALFGEWESPRETLAACIAIIFGTIAVTRGRIGALKKKRSKNADR